MLQPLQAPLALHSDFWPQSLGQPQRLPHTSRVRLSGRLLLRDACFSIWTVLALFVLIHLRAIPTSKFCSVPSAGDPMAVGAPSSVITKHNEAD